MYYTGFLKQRRNISSPGHTGLPQYLCPKYKLIHRRLEDSSWGNRRTASALWIKASDRERMGWVPAARGPPEQEKGSTLQSHHAMHFASSWCLLNPVQGWKTWGGPTKVFQANERGETHSFWAQTEFGLSSLSQKVTKSCLKAWKKKLQLYQKQEKPRAIKRWDKKKGNRKSCSSESLNWIFF